MILCKVHCEIIKEYFISLCEIILHVQALLLVLLNTFFIMTFVCCWYLFLQMSLGGSSVAVVQLPGGQFQVQGVIQSAQSSVIQSPQVQTAQVSPLHSLQSDTNQAITHNHCRRCVLLNIGSAVALTNVTCASFRPPVPTVKTHRTPRTAESAPRRPEKF